MHFIFIFIYDVICSTRAESSTIFPDEGVVQVAYFYPKSHGRLAADRFPLWGATAPLAPPLATPLLVCLEGQFFKNFHLRRF